MRGVRTAFIFPHNFDYAAVKAKGLQRTEGKEYVVNDGDVIEFLFNV